MGFVHRFGSALNAHLHFHRCVIDGVNDAPALRKAEIGVAMGRDGIAVAKEAAALHILPVQILWINMSTAVLRGLMLAFEAKEPGIMLRRPRDPEPSILTRRLVFRIVLVGAPMLAGAFGLFQWEVAQGVSLAKAHTVAVNVFVSCDLFYCPSQGKTTGFSRSALAARIGLRVQEALWSTDTAATRFFRSSTTLYR